MYFLISLRRALHKELSGEAVGISVRDFSFIHSYISAVILSPGASDFPNNVWSYSANLSFCSFSMFSLLSVKFIKS